MATATEIALFIEMIAPLAQKAYRTLGKVKPSVCIGMACVESAYGTSQLMKKHNAYFGQKVGTGKTAVKYWSMKFFTSSTKEEYTLGQHTTIRAAFRAYDSAEQSVFNYYELLNTSLYSKVLATSDYREQMQQIKECKYMTSSTEVNSVISIIEKYNLTKYDVVEDNPYVLTAEIVKRGDRGESVKWLQFQLSLNGAKLDVDGIFGPKTEEAVISYKQSKNLLGIAGKETLEAIK